MSDGKFIFHLLKERALIAFRNCGEFSFYPSITLPAMSFAMVVDEKMCAYINEGLQSEGGILCDAYQAATLHHSAHACRIRPEVHFMLKSIFLDFFTKKKVN